LFFTVSVSATVSIFVRRAFPVFRTVRISVSSSTIATELSATQYERLSTETLDNFAEVFEMIGEQYDLGSVYDVHHDYGVLKVEFGPAVGTYILNRQAPNKQLWLSSPLSGPKRYDFLASKGEWIYKHDGTALHNLLHQEISNIVGHPIEFPKK
uniref:ferroxidase n=1 Tax=Echinostoma caproni TaxID=27848 RepID=A0A183ANR8_9TREM